MGTRYTHRMHVYSFALTSIAMHSNATTNISFMNCKYTYFCILVSRVARFGYYFCICTLFFQFFLFLVSKAKVNALVNAEANQKYYELEVRLDMYICTLYMTCTV